MRHPLIRVLSVVGGLCFLFLVAAGREMRTYQTPYYTIHSDVSPEVEREAEIRITRMAEEYHQRTSDFAGAIRERLPFYLFSDARDYYAAGAPRGSDGVFKGDRLMAFAGDKGAEGTWHVVQHEGFHQFVHAVIGGDVPIWANEGLAEYFGEAIFTGDGFVCGVIPPGRLDRVKKAIAAGQMHSIEGMLNLSHAQWNSRLDINNYDQAWSMVHFLAHADNGRYQAAFAGFMNEISRGRTPQRAWANNFGGTDGFEAEWKKYWTSLPANPTRGLYVKAIVAILTSHLGRASAQKQTFSDFNEFQLAATSGKLKISADDWLPPSLLREATEATAALQKYGGKFDLVRASPGAAPRIRFTSESINWIGSYSLSGGRVKEVNVEPAKKAPVPPRSTTRPAVR